MTKPGLQPIGATAAAAELAKKKHREWLWCRRKNGFSDLPLWREIAVQLELPIYQVVALADRLEELANHAGNIGHNRGYVGHFRASEFAAALGMPADQAARIYAALEHPDIGWIVEGHVADFYDRNRDGDDVDDKTQAERARRSRAFRSAIKELERQRRAGQITPELFSAHILEIAGMKELARDGQLDERDLKRRLFELQYGSLSTAADRHRASHRDAVTVTTEHSATTPGALAAVDNSGAASRGGAPGQPEQQVAGVGELTTEQAELWLAGDGAKIVVERMQVETPRATTLVERWQRDEGPVTLARILAASDSPKLNAAQFQVLVHQQLERCREARLKGEPLPLPPVWAFGTAPLIPQSHRHGVTASPVDNPPAIAMDDSPPRSGTDG